MITAYHASQKRLSQPSTIVWGKSGDYGPGMYFATKPEDTSVYGGVLHKAELDPQHALVVGSSESDALAAKLLRLLGAAEMLDVMDARESMWPQAMEFVPTAIDLGLTSWGGIGKWLIKQGFDSIKAPNKVLKQRASNARVRGDYYAVLDASVIVSWEPVAVAGKW